MAKRTPHGLHARFARMGAFAPLLMPCALIAASILAAGTSATFPTALAQGLSTPVGSVNSFTGLPFLYEARYDKTRAARRRSEDAIYNGVRTRVVRLENGLSLFDGDTVVTPADASMEVNLDGGSVWLIHPESRVEILGAPRGLRILAGRATLLTSGSGAQAGVVILAGGKHFEAPPAGFFATVDGAGNVQQGNDMRQQELTGFDAPTPMPATAPASNPTPMPMQPPLQVVPAAGSPQPDGGKDVRPKNPLDDTNEEEEQAARKGGTPATSERPQPAVSPPAPSSRDTAAPSPTKRERGRAHLAFGKALGGTTGLARRIWSVHAGVVTWVDAASQFGIQFDADLFPLVSGNKGGMVETHRRSVFSLGLRLASHRVPLGFYFVPQIGVVRFIGTLDVGRGANGATVFAEEKIGPAVFSGLQTGVEFPVEDWSFSGHGSVGIRYSADRVTTRLLGLEADARYFIRGSGVLPGPFLRAFTRMEDFRTEKKTGGPGMRHVQTRWTLLGAGGGVTF